MLHLDICEKISKTQPHALIIPNKSPVTKEDRQRLNGHRSMVLWFTGLSGSGKTTISQKLEERFLEKGIHTYILDGDNIRTGLNHDLGFSDKDRQENIRRIGEVAKLFVDAGVIVLTAFISPYRKDRLLARNLLQKDEFVEIYIRCPLVVCEKRDVKGLYRMAREGVLKKFTGIDDRYEEPENPEIAVDTNVQTVHQCVETILGELGKRKLMIL